MSDYVSGKKQASCTEVGRRVVREKGASSSDVSIYKSSAEESVRYKGSRASSVYKGSEEYIDYICDPCNSVEDHVEAQGFCTNCKEYLCDECLKGHSRSKTSLHHTLLDKDNMPKTSKRLCDPCKRVGDEKEAAGYCTDCGEYLCSSCFRSHARNKTSRQHVLLDKDNMPESTDSALTSSVAKMNLYISDADSLKYNEKYTYIRDINIKTENCYISRMTLVSSTELVLADSNNKSLKLVDPVNNVIKDSLRLETFPGGLTTISQNQVAVVLWGKCKIQIISVSGELSVVRTLNTNGKCVDVHCINGKLYVSFWEPVQFQILKLTGAVRKTITPDSEVLKHCTLPSYIAVSPDESMIYISDWKTNKVMCIDLNGNMISMFQGELDKPGDITISPFGSVYLCNREQHVVYKMTSDLSEAAVILGQGDGLRYPQAMCFNNDKQQLYISSGSEAAKYKNYLKVFQLKYVNSSCQFSEMKI